MERDLRRFGGALEGRVLDAGSGAHNRYAAAFGAVVEWVRLDLNPDYKPDIVGSVTAIPAAGSSFDGVLCTQVIGDVLRPHEAVEEFARVLKSGGTLVLTEGFINELHGEPRDYYRFTVHGLAALCEDAGLRVEHSYLSGGPAAVRLQMRSRLLIRMLRLAERPLLAKIFSKLFYAWGLWARFADARIYRAVRGRFGLVGIVVARKP